MLCGRCSNVDFQEVINALTDETVVEFEHHTSWSDLNLAVSTQCELCTLLKRAVYDAYSEELKWSDEETAQHHLRKDQEQNTIFILSTVESGHGIRYGRRHDSTTRKDFTDHELHVDTHFPDGLANVPFLRVCLEDGDYLSLNARAISESVDFELCRSWINMCSSSHTRCSSIADMDLPTRLIDVGAKDGTQEPKLVITKGLKGQYITLSHCWGNTRSPVTDKVTFMEYLDCIPFATLPRTFQDAVTTVRKLGYRYLWIDCFCIIQGDQQDWEIECANMHNIFELSALTIAGPGASNSEVGFLHRRAQPAVPPYKHAIRDSRGIELGQISFHLRDSGACGVVGHPKMQDESALDTRAWIVQERYLSSRTLYFGTSQAYLECQSTQFFETCTKPQLLVLANDRMFRRDVGFNTDLLQNLTTWYQVLQIYCTRSLTKESDRLPALSGIANRMAKLSDDLYLAGMWKSDLLTGLNWQIPYYQREKGRRSRLHSSIKPPSWSWASCDYPTTNEILGPGRESEWRAKIIDVSTSVPGLDPYGEVTGGKLVLEGKLRRACAYLRDESSKDDDFWVRHIDKAWTAWYITEPKSLDIEVAGLAFDNPSLPEANPSESSTSREIWCFLLGHHSYNLPAADDAMFISARNNIWTALALNAVAGSKNTFRRIGLIISVDYSQNEMIQSILPTFTASMGSQVAQTFFDNSEFVQVEII